MGRERLVAAIPDDGVSAHGMAVPVAVQSLVNYLARYPVADATSHLIDKLWRHAPTEPRGLSSRGPPRRIAPADSSGWVHVAIGMDDRAGRIASRRLTPRQYTIADALSSGLADRTIAHTLGISTTTVREHAAALTSLRTRTRSELVAALAAVHRASID